ncbi:hypothetical protein LWI29_022015 [Acer saccharum]|uniref:Uncharacterized protein n=1 Tax=Acer saccharum TaxID=4024 RepID=A0AA39T593_ACESA|nr:hypothetical protein LWI29_022015 [Acer saccharum]
MEEMMSIARLGLAVAGGGWTMRREGDSWVVQCAAVSPPVEVNGLEGTVENRLNVDGVGWVCVWGEGQRWFVMMFGDDDDF